SCPGTAVDWEQLLAEAADRKSKLRKSAAETSRQGETREFDDKYNDARQRIEKIRIAAATAVAGPADPSSAEPADEQMTFEESHLYSGRSIHVEPTPNQARGGGGPGTEIPLTAEIKQMLRRHVVSLVQGEFSDEGLLPTSASDVTAIFERSLPEALVVAQRENRPLRIMFYCHGGLHNEHHGLQMAAKQIPWWISNEIYPIHFVWHTGFLETVSQLLRGSREVQAEAQRGLTDISDRAVEAVARRAGPLTVWSGMKRSAERASAKSGGASFVADLLNTFCAAHGSAVELHAVGHSAGSIFHSWFLNRANSLGVRSFKSVHFLAPAVRTDVFKKKLNGMMGEGKGIDVLRIYTMTKDWELEDNVAQVYRKSLLYMIYYALEPTRETPILGLEESLQGDTQLAKLFGLSGTAPGKDEVIFSVSRNTDGNRASTSKTHGCFDNDPATMNSVTRWILQREQIQPLPSTLSQECEASQRAILNNAPAISPQPVVLPGTPSLAPTFVVAGTSAAAGPITPSRRRALCIGINDYLTAPLNGCVADAESWAATLTRLGFETTILRNGQATQRAILSSLENLIVGSHPGDIVVFQFAGHGTQLPDANKDEIGQDTAQDEALCPHDFASGAFVIDDDVSSVFRHIPDGVSVTCFIDCCHSGTISRFAVGTSPQSRSGADRPRFMEATPEMKAAHLQYRSAASSGRAAVDRGPDLMREVVFSACLSREVAWESAGHGDFTTRATALIASGIVGISNEEFHRRVVAAFGTSARQHPYLDCPLPLRQRQLLAWSGTDSRIPDAIRPEPS
ncbi:MAG TPA: caspase family protein, partial [Lacipirellulaceae bacterium]